MAATKYFDTRKAVQDYMTHEAAKRGIPLASGVGNDMSGPFYVADSRFVERFHPDGIGGPIEYLDYSQAVSGTV